MKLILLCLFLCLSGCVSTKRDDLSYLEEIENYFYLSLDEVEILEIEDDHGGFHGDGMTYVTCKVDQDVIDKQRSLFIEEPLSDEVLYLIKYFNLEFLKEESVGYWNYINQNGDKPLSSQQASYNFMLIYYNMETNILHYTKIDT